MIRILGPDVAIGELVREAQRTGDEVVVVPAGATKGECLDLFAAALHFPEWFGRNLDALADCLHDFAEQPLGDGRARHLIWDGVGTLRKEHPETFEDIAGVLDEVSEDHDTLVVTILDR